MTAKSQALIAFIVVIFLAGMNIQPAVSEGKRKRELPKSGTLAGALSAGRSDQAVSMPWGGTDLEGSGAPPITGSVSRRDKRHWVMKLFNNSKDRHSVSVEVIQFGKQGKRLRRDSYSYTLRGKQDVQREITANASTWQCILNLTYWRNLDQEKRDREDALKKAQEELEAKVANATQKKKALRTGK